jgi:hypothetical protein
VGMADSVERSRAFAPHGRARFGINNPEGPKGEPCPGCTPKGIRQDLLTGRMTSRPASYDILSENAGAPPVVRPLEGAQTSAEEGIPLPISRSTQAKVSARGT